MGITWDAPAILTQAMGQGSIISSQQEWREEEWGISILRMSPHVSRPLSSAYRLSASACPSKYKKSFPYTTMARFRKGDLFQVPGKAQPDIIYLGADLGHKSEGQESMRQGRRKGQHEGMSLSCCGCQGLSSTGISWNCTERGQGCPPGRQCSQRLPPWLLFPDGEEGWEGRCGGWQAVP